MKLEPFQAATVDAAVEALTRPGGSRRFLIADEVGLGKTVSAKAIAAELQRRRGEPFNVVYLCPNLDIASQNLAKLSALQPDWPDPEDRLSLVLRRKPEGATDFRIYSYTPDTSLPGWKPGQRTGRAAERDLIGALLRELAPTLWSSLRAADRVRESLGQRRWFSSRLDVPPPGLARAFERALRELTGLVGRPLDDGLQAQLEGWTGLTGHKRSPAEVACPELILRCRASLALAALRDPACHPDLLILDEFHRYADLLVPSRAPPSGALLQEHHRVQRALVDALIGDGEEGPAVLLLSATPYRLQRLDRGEIPGGPYAQFVELVRFLYGPPGGEQAEAAKLAIDAHRQALSRRDDPAAAVAEVGTAKRELETLLRPVVARTERATAITGELFDRRDNPARIEANDLVTFRHLARAVSRKKGALRSWVQPLWSSAPYPAETLFRYGICKALSADLPPVTIASDKGRPAHPRLRALVNGGDATPSTLSPDALALPWLAPTKRWWKLGGRWAELDARHRLAGKALLFSRYRGTPAAVSLWLSAEVERRPGARRGKSNVKTQAYLRPEAKSPWPLIALFMPWPVLSAAFDPGKGEELKASDVRRAAREELKRWLRKHEVTIGKTATSARKPWRLAFDLEAHLGSANNLTRALKSLGGLAPPGAWRSSEPLSTVSSREVQALADWMLGAPGIVVARTLRRHWTTPAPGLSEVFGFCWRQLRPYLGQRYFASTLLGSRRRKTAGGYPEALREAIVEGGLEATLDEHVAVMRLIGDATPLEILSESLVGRAGRVQRRTTRGTRPARVHAAAPYLGAERRNDSSKRSEKLRSDTLRKAFNSPFWPHVLTTTSIGQEGLDFHVWCDRVIHWDLPRDPVDFEQREGRVARYASLGVRRALAQAHRAPEVPPWSSPFRAVFQEAREAKPGGLGLERWWSPADNKPVSVTFSVPFSRGDVKLRRLQEDLVRYRLALGQPEPKLFEAMIAHFALTHEQARELALNLSPAGTVGSQRVLG